MTKTELLFIIAIICNFIALLLTQFSLYYIKKRMDNFHGWMDAASRRQDAQQDMIISMAKAAGIQIIYEREDRTH